MNKEKYILTLKNKITDENTRNIIINQIENYYEAIKNFKPVYCDYKIGDKVYLTKGTLLHGTYKNIDGLKQIIKEGLISNLTTIGRNSKYNYTVGVWKLKKDYYLSDYINFYSGATIMYCSFNDKNITEVIPYNKMNNLLSFVSNFNGHVWVMEQTKEARFLPSLVQDRVQIGIIFNGNNKYIKKMLNYDILSLDFDENDVKNFISPSYYDRFIKERKNKNDFFTDRESAIIFGIPSIFIEGILVGRKYENSEIILNEIKSLLPNAYICNLDGVIIK